MSSSLFILFIYSNAVPIVNILDFDFEWEKTNWVTIIVLQKLYDCLTRGTSLRTIMNL